MLRILIMTLTLIALIIVNGVTNIVPLNGSTTGEIVNRLPVLFTPANYVSFIWIVIFLLLVFWIFRFEKAIETGKPLLNRRAFLFTLASLFNIAWIILWNYECFIWTLLIMAALLATLLILYFSYPKVENRLSKRIPIAAYLGWIIILFIVNLNYISIFYEWHSWGLSAPLWTVIFLTIATATSLHFLYHYRDVTLNLVFAWAFVGIAVKNSFEELFVSVAALFLSAALVACIFIFKKRSHPQETEPLE